MISFFDTAISLYLTANRYLDQVVLHAAEFGVIYLVFVERAVKIHEVESFSCAAPVGDGAFFAQQGQQEGQPVFQ